MFMNKMNMNLLQRLFFELIVTLKFPKGFNDHINTY